MVSACPESDLRSLTRDGLEETFIKGKCTNDINLPPVSESLIQPLVKYTRIKNECCAVCNSVMGIIALEVPNGMLPDTGKSDQITSYSSNGYKSVGK